MFPLYTELANCPDWLPLAVIVNGERFRLDSGEILSYERQLDLCRASSAAECWRSPSGKTHTLNFERFASLDEHVLSLRCQLTLISMVLSKFRLASTAILKIRASTTGIT